MDNLGRALGCIEPLGKLGPSQVASSSSWYLVEYMDSLDPSLGCILEVQKVDLEHTFESNSSLVSSMGSLDPSLGCILLNLKVDQLA